MEPLGILLDERKAPASSFAWLASHAPPLPASACPEKCTIGTLGCCWTDGIRSRSYLAGTMRPGRHHAYRPSCLYIEGHRRGRSQHGKAIYCQWHKTDGQQAAISGRDTGTTTIYVRCGFTQPECLRLYNRLRPPFDVHDLTQLHSLPRAACITETVKPCPVPRLPSAGWPEVQRVHCVAS